MLRSVDRVLRRRDRFAISSPDVPATKRSWGTFVGAAGAAETNGLGYERVDDDPNVGVSHAPTWSSGSIPVAPRLEYSFEVGEMPHRLAS